MERRVHDRHTARRRNQFWIEYFECERFPYLCDIFGKKAAPPASANFVQTFIGQHTTIHKCVKIIHCENPSGLAGF